MTSSSEKMMQDMEDALVAILCKPLRGETREAMQKTIARFFRDEISAYSQREVYEIFKTPDRAVKAFLEYVEKQDDLKSLDLG